MMIASFTSSRSQGTRMIIVCMILLGSNIWGSRTESARYTAFWGPQTAPVFENEYEDVCLGGRCMLKNGQRMDPQEMTFLMNHLHNNNNDNYAPEEMVDKRDPPSTSFHADSVLFRDANPTPCSCFSDSIPRPRDLGLGVYPRYLSDVECNSTSCGNPLFRCHSLNHTIFVLKRKSSFEEEDSIDLEAVQLPKPLSNKWKFEGVNITVACICQRHYSHST